MATSSLKREKNKSKKEKIGLVLVGGGARAAYQAGVLAGINEMLHRPSSDPFFSLISGVSAGSINGAFLAARAHDFANSFDALARVWERLKIEDVYRSNLSSIAKLGLRWARDLAFGGMMPNEPSANFLLETQPLHDLLRREVDFAKIHRNIREGRLDAFSVATTNYHTGTEICFFDSTREHDGWSRSSRLGYRTKIEAEHILASASIPLLFKPVPIGGFHFGDGSIRQGAPLSPMVHLGADRILAISVRHRRTIDFNRRLNTRAPAKNIALAEIFGVVLNAAFFDGLDYDVERMSRVNETVDYIHPPAPNGKVPFSLRKIPLLLLRPSQDLGAMALEYFKCFPATLRYMLKGIGASEEKGADFLSYLTFEAAYTRRVVELGYQDSMNQKDEILKFFEAPPYEETEREGRILRHSQII